MLAALCWTQGRIEDSFGYVMTGEATEIGGRQNAPFGIDSLYYGVYLVIGQPQRCVELCRAHRASGRDTLTMSWTLLVMALVIAGSADEARATADGLIEAAEATDNPGPSRTPCWPTASPSGMPSRTPHCRHFAAAWRSPKTPASGGTSRISP